MAGQYTEFIKYEGIPAEIKGIPSDYKHPANVC
jgi:hypothetical protein